MLLARISYFTHRVSFHHYIISSFYSYLYKHLPARTEVMAAVAGNKPHVMAVPVPALGHVKPLMKLCRHIAKHGIKVTFVNARSIHEKLFAAVKVSGREVEEEDNIVLTSVPDGLNPGDDPNNPFTLVESLPRTMPVTLVDLIERINTSNPNEKISCVIADASFGFVFEIAEKMGAEPVGFSPPSIACLGLAGSLKKRDVISLSDDLPPWREDEFPWSCSGELNIQKFFFECAQGSAEAANKAKWLLCNSCYELEPAACDLKPNLIPVGPLHLLEPSSSNSRSSFCNFHPEDASCLGWLDSRPAGSVVYVSFGSHAVLSQEQLDELALGLELSGRAFLWVVRPDLVNAAQAVYPAGFSERENDREKIVGWAPQNKVLSHPSVACFVSHCGWNSTVEGLSNGVPFLCWPYFADQFHNESYICDKWRIGLRIDSDERGIRSRYRIKKKIDMVFSDNSFKENALKLKELCEKSAAAGGSSFKNLQTFIDHLLK